MLIWHRVNTTLAGKGEFAAQPVIDDDGECILVAHCCHFAIELFGSHVVPVADDPMSVRPQCCAGHGYSTEARNLYTTILCEEQMLRLDITMSDVPIVGVLQSCGDLPDISDDGFHRQGLILGVCASERTAVGIGRDEIG